MWKESLLKLLKLDNFVANLTGYVETRVELLKLEMQEEIAKAMARVSVLVVVIASLSLFILFFSVAIALLLAEYVGYYEGFFIVAGFYLVITIFFLATRASISETLEKKLTEKFRKK